MRRAQLWYNFFDDASFEKSMDMVFAKELKPILDAKVKVLEAAARPHSGTQLLLSKTRLSVPFEARCSL